MGNHWKINGKISDTGAVWKSFIRNHSKSWLSKSRSGSNKSKQHEAKGGHHQAGAGIKFGRQILGFVNCVPFLGYAATCSPWSQREIHLWWNFFEDSNGQHGGSSAHVFFYGWLCHHSPTQKRETRWTVLIPSIWNTPQITLIWIPGWVIILDLPCDLTWQRTNTPLQMIDNDYLTIAIFEYPSWKSEERSYQSIIINPFHSHVFWSLKNNVKPS